MRTSYAPEPSGRVLAVVATPRFTGQAAVDGHGLVSGSFATWKLGRFPNDEARIRCLEANLIDSLRKHQPSAVVVGIPRFDDERSGTLRESAMRLVSAAGVEVVVRSVGEARLLLLGCQRGPCDDALAARLTEGFFPELADFRKAKQTMQRKYRRHAFDATAVAVLELVERAPLSAAVIAKDAAFAMGTFNDALTASARRHFPDNL